MHQNCLESSSKFPTYCKNSLGNSLKFLKCVKTSCKLYQIPKNMYKYSENSEKYPMYQNFLEN